MSGVKGGDDRYLVIYLFWQFCFLLLNALFAKSLLPWFTTSDNRWCIFYHYLAMVGATGFCSKLPLPKLISNYWTPLRQDYYFIILKKQFPLCCWLIFFISTNFSSCCFLPIGQHHLQAYLMLCPSVCPWYSFSISGNNCVYQLNKKRTNPCLNALLISSIDDLTLLILASWVPIRLFPKSL